jgi:Beta-propeller repeat
VSNVDKMVLGRVFKTCLFFLLAANVEPARLAPRIVYGTYLGGRHKDCATAIAVDITGNAYVVGRTPSPDFPVTAGAFITKTEVHNNDWIGFLSKISSGGDRLLYSTFLGGNYRSSVSAVAVDSSGRAFVVGPPARLISRPQLQHCFEKRQEVTSPTRATDFWRG